MSTVKATVKDIVTTKKDVNEVVESTVLSRAIAESTELSNRMEGLSNFRDSSEFQSIAPEVQGLLLEQLQGMVIYHSALSKRIVIMDEE